MELQEVRRWSTEILAWSVYDNTLYYYASERGTFCEYDLTTGAEKTFSQLDYFGGAAYYDDTYIYLITWNDDDGNGKGLSIFSRDYQLLERIEFSANQDLLYDAQDKLIFTRSPARRRRSISPNRPSGRARPSFCRLKTRIPTANPAINRRADEKHNFYDRSELQDETSVIFLALHFVCLCGRLLRAVLFRKKRQF